MLNWPAKYTKTQTRESCYLEKEVLGQPNADMPIERKGTGTEKVQLKINNVLCNIM